MIFQVILLGFARFCLADGFFTQTQNAVNHYRNGYYSRNSGIPSRSSVKSFSKYLTSLQEHPVKKLRSMNPKSNSNISRHDRKYSHSRTAKFSNSIQSSKSTNGERWWQTKTRCSNEADVQQNCISSTIMPMPIHLHRFENNGRPKSLSGEPWLTFIKDHEKPAKN